jgi:hypothetical protein
MLKEARVAAFSLSTGSRSSSSLSYCSSSSSTTSVNSDSSSERKASFSGWLQCHHCAVVATQHGVGGVESERHYGECGGDSLEASREGDK